jgi:ribosomal protein S18 acetylase RimI-like enzyme
VLRLITFTNQISVEDYNNLRKSVGWNKIKPERAQKGINNSVCFVAADGGKTVGLARLISDGGYVSAIYDVIILPEYQGQGIGKSLMINVMEYIMSDLEEGENQMICLFAAKGKETFYKKFGFLERPNDQLGAGMTQWVKKTAV